MKISGGQNSGNQDNLIENGLIKFSLSTQTKVFFFRLIGKFLLNETQIHLIN